MFLGQQVRVHAAYTPLQLLEGDTDAQWPADTGQPPTSSATARSKSWMDSSFEP